MEKAKQQSRSIKLKHDKEVKVATAASRKSTTWKNKQMMYSDFVNKVSKTVRTKETFAEYMKLSKAEQDEIKDVGGYVFGSLKGGRRKADAVAWRDAITLDADFVEGDFWDGVTMMFDNACVMYSTHKHQPEKPRLRLIIPLSRSVTVEEYVAIGKKLAEQFGIDYFDDTCYEPHRLMYWGSTASDGEYLFEYQDAPFLDPQDILNMYNDWRDPREWPESSRQREARKRMADKQGDPLEKPGIIGAFCRTYSITEAIETFLAESYESAGEGRYTFTGGSTTGGLVLYDDKFAYSHHGTDPVSGQLVNAYDLVRLHKFGELDDDAKEGTPINRLPSTVRMREFLAKDERVKVELVQSNISSAFEDFADSFGEDKEDVKKALFKQLDLKNDGSIEPSTGNIELLIETLYGDCFKFDTFSNKRVRVKNVEWRKDVPLKKDSFEIWDDTFDSESMFTEIEKAFKISINYQKARSIVNKLIYARSFNPVKDSIQNTKWDGVERAETLLIDYLGAENNEFSRLAAIHFLKGVIYRVWEPGCKFDEAIVLTGAQGIGKSLFVSKMAIERKWFTDTLDSFDPKKGGEILQGKLLIELSELAAMRKSEVEDVKRFLTVEIDHFRGAYERTAKEFPRQCVFVGTTNETEFLQDGTGNRRFIPIECCENRRKKHPADLDRETVLQVYAEVLEKHYIPFKSVYMDEKLKGYAAEAQKAAMMQDPLLSDVEIYLNTPVPHNFDEWAKSERKQYHYQTNGPAPANFNTLSDGEKAEWFKANSTYLLDAGQASKLVLPRRVSAKEAIEEGLRIDSVSVTRFKMREYASLIRQTGWIQESKNAKKMTKAYGQQKVFSRPK